MAERLTETNELYNKRVILNNEENQITLSNIRFDGSITKAYYWGKPIDKLAQLEDIMEKYGIESVEELNKKLADGITWQRACELANEECNKLSKYDEIIDELNFSPYTSDYFYKQTKMKENNKQQL